ncbi:hypothetical protein [Streptomyces graminofaciens]|nr:hypothetical protein [Streptomyces graminofaciens]
MTRASRTQVAVGVGAAAVVVATGLAMAVTGDKAGEKAGEKGRSGERAVILAEGSDRLPAQTAEDWVTYADHAVVVTAVDEAAVEPDTADPDDPAGAAGPVMREVTLRVDKVLWSAENPAHSAPSSFRWDAYGWHQDEDGGRVEMSGANEPRIEPGHTYVMALQWEPPRCPPGDEPIPGQWRGLGDESTIPYDGQVLGKGEFEGETRTAEAARSAESGASGVSALDTEPEGEPEYVVLRDEYSGRSAEELAGKLKSTEPVAAAEESGAPGAAALAAADCE